MKVVYKEHKLDSYIFSRYMIVDVYAKKKLGEVHFLKFLNNEDKKRENLQKTLDLVNSSEDSEVAQNVVDLYIRYNDDLNKYEKCVGCGYCCIKRTCVMGIRYNPKNAQRRCSFLKWDGDKYRCRLVKTMSHLKKEIYIGEGCPSTLFNEWRHNVQER